MVNQFARESYIDSVREKLDQIRTPLEVIAPIIVVVNDI